MLLLCAEDYGAVSRMKLKSSILLFYDFTHSFFFFFVFFFFFFFFFFFGKQLHFLLQYQLAYATSNFSLKVAYQFLLKSFSAFGCLYLINLCIFLCIIFLCLWFLNSCLCLINFCYLPLH